MRKPHHNSFFSSLKECSGSPKYSPGNLTRRFVLTGSGFLLDFNVGRPAAQTLSRYKAEKDKQPRLI